MASEMYDYMPIMIRNKLIVSTIDMDLIAWSESLVLKRILWIIHFHD